MDSDRRWENVPRVPVSTFFLFNSDWARAFESCQPCDQLWKVQELFFFFLFFFKRCCCLLAGLRAAPSCGYKPNPINIPSSLCAPSAIILYKVHVIFPHRPIKCETFPECIISHRLCIVSYFSLFCCHQWIYPVTLVSTSSTDCHVETPHTSSASESITFC